MKRITILILTIILPSIIYAQANDKRWLYGVSVNAGGLSSNPTQELVYQGNFNAGRAFGGGLYIRNLHNHKNYFFTFGLSYNTNRYSSTPYSVLTSDTTSIVLTNNQKVITRYKKIRAEAYINYYIMRRYYDNVYLSFGLTPQIPLPGKIKYNDTKDKIKPLWSLPSIAKDLASFNISASYEYVIKDVYYLSAGPEYNFSYSAYNTNDVVHYWGIRVSLFFGIGCVN